MSVDNAGAPRRLQRLHEDYVFKVNAAVAEERWDLVSELVDTYFAEAQNAVVEGESGVAVRLDSMTDPAEPGGEGP